MEERKILTRRSFLAKSVIASGGIILSSHIVACVRDFEGDADAPDSVPRFLHGVGSFDPTANAVIIWTRFTPIETEVSESIRIRWQVAEDEGFSAIVKEGTEIASMINDFTIAKDVTRLPSKGKFYYRFLQEELNETSVVGETITLPNSGDVVDSVKLAVCSCSNYPAGLFNVYDAMANSEADVIVHLGDYIYEYEEGGFGTNENTVPLGRVHDPSTEILSLEDYRLRYRQYRSDEALQLAHQKKPFIAVWDDHELTNDAYIDGAENHDSSEGSFQARRQRAVQVYNEYMPFRSNSSEIIYRNFEFGNLVNLVMLDTRIIARDQQLSFNDFFTAAGFDFAAFETALLNPERNLLGPTQLSWARNAVAGSSAQWQVLGQQVLTGRMFVPAELLIAIGTVASGNATAETFAQLQQTIIELSTLKARSLQGDPTLTPTELARINTVVPYNLDAWDGYPIERERLFATLNGKNVITLAGDTHNAWNTELKDAAGNRIGEEFACPSVSSPGFEGLFGNDPATIAGIEQAFVLLIDDLQYFDAARRGYVLAEFTSGTASGSYRFVDTLASTSYSVTEQHNAVVSVSV
ncbi:alkaline phosphatase D family protein [Spongiimicrobium salis]|uniref:alkaline phosphatase D family protein n=1 Tax=Spongiimicrobium salis TaxID=1667022 RepID=UPI00374DF6A8